MMHFGFEKSSKKGAAAAKEKDGVHLQILRQAQQSGSLNLSNRNLETVPNAVWNLNSPLPVDDAATNVNLDRTDNTEVRWWELQPLSRLTLTSNQLTHLPGEGLAKLDTLTHLDVRDNQLIELPNEIGQLTTLKSLVLSANKLTLLPDNLGKLHELVVLDLTGNRLQQLGSNFAGLINLDRLDVSNNQLTQVLELPPRVRKLDLSHNQIESLPDGLLEQRPVLASLDLSHNRLTTLLLDTRDPSNRSASALVTLKVGYNRLEAVPDVAGLCQLKELFVGDNRLTTLNYATLKGCPIVILDVARNHITELPEGIAAALPHIARLDVSANDLTMIPTELGLIDSLQSLIVERNPLRSIRQNVFQGGTNAVKDLLRQRHIPPSEPVIIPPVPAGDYPQPEEVASNPAVVVQVPTAAEPVKPSNNSTTTTPTSVKPVAPTVIKPPASKVFDIPTVSNAGLLDWKGTAKNGTAASALPPLDSEEDWLLASGSKSTPVRSLQLEHRLLTSMPRGIFAFAPTLTVLNLTENRLMELPDDVARLTKLTSLELCRNNLHTLPESLSTLGELTSLRLDYNPLGPEVPFMAAILSGPLARSLEKLSLRACKLKQVPCVDRLQQSSVPNLFHLDLADNDINSLPPELGLCTHLKSLLLTGNTFRIPRPNIVSKGTPAILEYLRGRIP